MEPAFQSAASLAADLRERRIGCRELLDHFIARVDRFNPDLNAIVVSDFERARERARAADAALARGEAWGPLHGLPMTVKDSYDVAGLPTTWGAPELRGNVPETNAVAIDRLLAAGAVVFGKTNVPYNLADFQSYNDVYGTTNNPWDLERVPGGSSGGAAAALAAGLTGLEAGSDIGGSIRNPAHYCGVYGHKPTWGILPLRGHAKPGVLAPTDISAIGPLARDAGDLALALDVMAGPDPSRRTDGSSICRGRAAAGPATGGSRCGRTTRSARWTTRSATRSFALRTPCGRRGPRSTTRPAPDSTRRRRTRSIPGCSRARSPRGTATRSSGGPWTGPRASATRTPRAPGAFAPGRCITGTGS